MLLVVEGAALPDALGWAVGAGGHFAKQVDLHVHESAARVATLAMGAESVVTIEEVIDRLALPRSDIGVEY